VNLDADTRGQKFDAIDSSIVAQSHEVAVVTENYTRAEDLLFNLHFSRVYFGSTATRKYQNRCSVGLTQPNVAMRGPVSRSGVPF